MLFVYLFTGSFPAEACVTALEQRPQEFKIDLKHDIVSLTTDGAAVMKKVGRLIPPYHQLCFAHGLQLAVVDVLYKNSAKEVNDSDRYREQIAVINSTDDESDAEYTDDEQNDFPVERCVDEIDLLPQYK